jgi:hypothetical protein
VAGGQPSRGEDWRAAITTHPMTEHDPLAAASTQGSSSHDTHTVSGRPDLRLKARLTRARTALAALATHPVTEHDPLAAASTRVASSHGTHIAQAARDIKPLRSVCDRDQTHPPATIGQIAPSSCQTVAGRPRNLPHSTPERAQALGDQPISALTTQLQRRGRDSNPRWTEPPIPVFETDNRCGAIVSVCRHVKRGRPSHAIGLRSTSRFGSFGRHLRAREDWNRPTDAADPSGNANERSVGAQQPQASQGACPGWADPKARRPAPGNGTRTIA